MRVGIVIRKDGTVPFDEPVNPEVKRRVVEYLQGQGHTLEAVEGTPHLRIVNN